MAMCHGEAHTCKRWELQTDSQTCRAIRQLNLVSAAIAQRSTKTAIVHKTDAVGKLLQHADRVSVLLIEGVQRLSVLLACAGG